MHGKYSGPKGGCPQQECKVPWPFATREMLVTSFELELPELDAVVPQEAETIVKETIHGFNASHLPPPKEGVIRMEANGGFILQKISDEKCYIRAVMHLDLKLDLVPTWVINFLGRLTSLGVKLWDTASGYTSREQSVSRMHQATATLQPHNITDATKIEPRKWIQELRCFS
ncbi:hypothetical protein SELMODRAFT_425868 [Selaginella moellendorffii]|uniref:START domain-containing protein n=1 Tax=Selaginella moellendorffii TaxID=88036 RepID=D8SUK2_SELML|nr:hypothetical protein SELMODRAFT_425868 [Selaginella moellendorffii]